MNGRASNSLRKALAVCILLFTPAIFSTVAFAISAIPAEQKKQFVEILIGVLPTATDAEFSVEMKGGRKESLKIGSLVAYEFNSSFDCYVTLISIDSQGIVTLLMPWAREQLKAGVTRQFPEIGSSEELKIQAPTGVETIASFCSSEIPPLMASIETQGVIAEGSDAVELLAAFVSPLVKKGILFERQIWQQRVVGRSVTEQYSDSDVVSFYTEKTRSLKNRKLPLDINFQYNSAKLTSRAKSSLDVIGKALISPKLNAFDFRLGGHTDSDGSDAYNLTLSRARATATQRYLVSKFSIDPVRLEVKPYGEQLPKADNNSAVGRAENRRVELVLKTR